MKKKNYLILLFCFFIFIFVILKNIFCKNENIKKEIIILNWAEYIEPSIIKDFNDINDEFIVKQIFLPSNEIAINKIKSGNKYDIAILSEYAIEQLKEKHLEKIDKEKIKSQDFITNDKKDFNYNDEFNKIKKKTNGNDVWDYNIPYFWGKLGLLYNKKINLDKSKNLKELEEIIKDDKYRIALYNNPFEVIFLGLKFTEGDISLNSENTKQDINKAKDWLIKLKREHKNLSFITDQLLDRMKIKDKENYDIVLAYSGDARYLMEKNNNLDYYQFDNKGNGTNVWFDGLCLPKEGNEEGAYKFINFLLKKENMKKNTKYIDFDSPYNKLDQNSILSLSVNENDKILSYNPNNQYKEQINEAWNQVYTYPDSKDKYLIIASLIILFFCFLIYLFLKI